MTAEIEAASERASICRERARISQGDVERADVALACARAAFEADPTAENEQAIELAERELRSAQRFAQVHATALERAELARTEAVRADGRAGLAALELQHDGVLREIGECLNEAEATFERMVALVERCHSALALDTKLVTEGRRLAETAEVEYTRQPLPPGVVRVAVGAHLSKSWSLPELPTRERPAGELERLAEDFVGNGSMVDRRTILRRLNDTWAELFGAEAFTWFALQPRLAWNDAAGGGYTARRREADRLLERIEMLKGAHDEPET